MRKTKIFIIAALTLFALAVVLYMTRPTSNHRLDSGPSDAARAWFAAALQADIEQVRALTCSDSAERVAASALDFAGLLAAGATVNADGLVYTTDSVEGDTALVTLSGAISATTPDATETVPMDGIAIPLVREDGAWKICGM